MEDSGKMFDESMVSAEQLQGSFDLYSKIETDSKQSIKFHEENMRDWEEKKSSIPDKEYKKHLKIYKDVIKEENRRLAEARRALDEIKIMNSNMKGKISG